MKLLCPKCNQTIYRQDVNLRTGISYCISCDEFFKIAEHLSPFQQINEAEKPASAKWSIHRDDAIHLLEHPKAGWSPANILVFCLALFSFLFLMVSFQGAETNVSMFLCLMFLALVAIFIYGFNVKHEIIINHRELLIIKRLFSYEYTTRRDYSDWEKIRVETEENEDARSYLVRLYFTESKSINLEKSSSMEEQQWLANELYKIKDELALEKAVVDRKL
jgi:hypothetical protein